VRNWLRNIELKRSHPTVFEHNGIPRPHGDGHLPRLIAHRRMIEGKTLSVVVRVGQCAMHRQAVMV
jgi:hypothetical protein